MGITGTAGGEAAKGATEGEAGKGAAEAAGTGLADAGTTAALGGGALDAGVTAGDIAGLTSGAVDAGAGTAALGDATAGLTAGIGGADAGTAALGDAAAGGLSSGGVGAGTASLDPITVSAPSTAGASAGTGLGSAAGAATPTAALAGATIGGGAGGGGSGVPGGGGALNSGVTPSDISSLTSGAGDVSMGDPGSFLPATGPNTVSGLSQNLADSFGIDTGDLSAGANSGAPGAAEISDLTGGVTGDQGSLIASEAGAPGADLSTPSVAGTGLGAAVGNDASDIGSWLSNPKNAATAGLLGLSLKSALSKPQLPGAAGTANAAATQAVQGATSVIQSGGTATPEWASQKASIDATINQQIQQQTEALQQAAATNGEGNQNSGIVQQQIAAMTSQANYQRQQLYAQAQQQNVQAALSELSGGDSTLTAIGNTQLSQSNQAQALAAQTAELALQLNAGTGVGGLKVPGQSSSTQVPGS